MPTNPSNGSLRARDLFEPTIRGIELELGVPIWSRLNGIDFPSFTKLIDELETAVEKKCNGQPLTAIAATKQRVVDIVGLAAESYRITTTEQLMSTSSESEDKAGRPFPIWNIGLGIIFSIAAIGMGVWAFNVGDLTDDRREILRWLLPIASAIAAGAFTGALSVKSKVLWPATVAASGGFAVWLLSTYVLFSTPKAADFALTIFIRDEQGKTIHANGELWLELKTENVGALVMASRYPGDSLELEWERHQDRLQRGRV